MAYNVVEELKQAFGDYESPSQEELWQAVKNSLSLHSTIKGKVVARFPFGVFLDAGVGFPILLEIIQMKDLTPQKYQTEYLKNICCVIGEEMIGKVVAFSDRSRQIGITQLNLDQNFK